MADVTIRPTENGPLIVEGRWNSSALKATGSHQRRTASRFAAVMPLQTNHFATALHSQIGFQAAEAVNPASAE